MFKTDPNILATWICIDTDETASLFPSAGGRSSNPGVQIIYWRCVLCFFAIARKFNPGVRLVLFSNRRDLPTLGETSVKKVLEHLKVDVYSVPFEFVTPTGYYESWRNQFFEFSILKFIGSHPDFRTDDNFILVDSDCAVTQSLDVVFRDIPVHQCITYIVDYSEDHNINGLTRREMKRVFGRYLGNNLAVIPDYHGGEFYASTVSVAAKLAQDFQELWPLLLEDCARQVPKLNEEAHVLSYLFLKNGFNGGQANVYIKRMWTDPATFRNVTAADLTLSIWHLPAEKKNGFRKLFHWLKEKDFLLADVPESQLRKKLSHIFMVPSVPAHRRPFFIAKKIMKKILQA